MPEHDYLFDKAEVQALVDGVKALSALALPGEEEAVQAIENPVKRHEAALQLLGALRERQRHSDEWQPIATAPKDGTRIFVMGAPPEWLFPIVVEWDDLLDNGCSAWWRHSDPSLDALYGVDSSITHWRPLPPPPQEQG